MSFSKIVYATFIGRDGSCGFKNGYQYKLTIQSFVGDRIIIREEKDSKKCGYSNIFKFLDNWDNICSNNYDYETSSFEEWKEEL